MKLYLLRKITNNLRITEFQSGIIGQNLMIFSEISSTNDYLKQRLSKSEPLTEGSVILAVHQTKGRGQMDSIWKTRAGENLTFSFPLYPRFLSIQNQFWLNIGISLAVLKSIQEVLPKHDVSIKWPNDILINNKKASGMLIENSLKGKIWNYSIVGIGININQEDFEVDTQFSATSFKNEDKQHFDLDQVFQIVCKHLNHYYTELQDSENWDDLKQTYLDNLLGYNKIRSFRIQKSGFIQEGVIQNVDEFGQLCIQIDGRIEKFGLKEVQFIS